MPNLTEQHKLALTAALAMAIGAVVTSAIDEDSPDKKPLVDAAKETKLDPSLVVDPAKYHEAVKAAREAAGPNVVDLLSAPCEPQVPCTTGVNVPHGARIGSIEYTGAAVDAFSAPAGTATDGETATRIEVTATNQSDKAARLTALVGYVLP
jgi:hypothetical protein